MNLFNLQNNGLKLINLPTGFGKTHMMLEYVIKHLKSNKPERIFIIANQHKLLDYEKFINMLKARGLDSYINKCDKYKSMPEHLYDFIKNKDNYNEFTRQIKDNKSQKELEKILRNFKNIYKNPAYLKEAQELEISFRKKIKKIAGIDKIINKFYPQVDFLDKKLCF